jgi:flagellar hook protein FlgE
VDISSIALQGLEQAYAQLDAAASCIAGTGAVQYGAALDTVSLSEELVALMTAQSLFAANINVLKTADQTQQSLLNILV